MICPHKSNFFDKNDTSYLKGILSIIIVIVHIWGEIAIDFQNTKNYFLDILGIMITLLGYLAVAMFLFITGFGLMTQYKIKKDLYIKNFFKKRVLPLCVINLILIVVYSIFNLIIGNDVSIEILIKSTLFGGTIISKGWYLQAIILCYVLFFCCFKYFKTEKIKLISFFLSLIIYIIVCLILKLSSFWYESIMCIFLGMLFAIFFDKIINIIFNNKAYWFVIITTIMLFVISFILGNNSGLPFAFRITFKGLSSCIFCILIVLTLRFIPIGNIVTKFLGKISLELYVTHGLFLKLFRCEYIYINKWYIYSFIVIVCSIIFASIIHPFFKKILTLKGKNQ